MSNLKEPFSSGNRSGYILVQNGGPPPQTPNPGEGGGVVNPDTDKRSYFVIGPTPR